MGESWDGGTTSGVTGALPANVVVLMAVSVGKLVLVLCCCWCWTKCCCCCCWLDDGTDVTGLVARPVRILLLLAGGIGGLSDSSSEKKNNQLFNVQFS